MSQIHYQDLTLKDMVALANAIYAVLPADPFIIVEEIDIRNPDQMVMPGSKKNTLCTGAVTIVLKLWKYLPAGNKKGHYKYWMPMMKAALICISVIIRKALANRPFMADIIMGCRIWPSRKV